MSGFILVWCTQPQPYLNPVSHCVVSKSRASLSSLPGDHILEASELDRHLGDLNFCSNSAIMFPWELGPITKHPYASNIYSLSNLETLTSVYTVNQFSCCCSFGKLCHTLCDPMDCSTSGFPVLHSLLEFAQVHVLWIGGAIQPSHSLSPSSPFAFNISQHQGLFQWDGCLHQMAKVLELQLQHQSIKWVFGVDFL